jgi:hypothetical protein
MADGRGGRDVSGKGREEREGEERKDGVSYEFLRYDRIFRDTTDTHTNVCIP